MVELRLEVEEVEVEVVVAGKSGKLQMLVEVEEAKVVLAVEVVVEIGLRRKR